MTNDKNRSGILARPFLILLALVLLLGLGYATSILLHPTVRTRQIASVIRHAGHGKVAFVQARRADGILTAQVRYPNQSLHTVFFLTHNGKIRGIVVGGHVYNDQGKTWTVAWTSPHQLQLPVEPKPLPREAVPHEVVPREATLREATLREAVLHAASFAQGFSWGRDKHSPIDAFVDPNCLFCHQWFDTEKAAVQAGKISFRIIPVAALKPSSVPRAIEIMSAKKPLSLWLSDENGFDASTESGGIPPNCPKTRLAVCKTMSKTVAVNTAVLYAVDQHHPYTPTFVDTRTGQVWIGVNHNQEIAHAFQKK
ncbi:hypothetical protein ACJU26_05310 [Acidithiobacillus sp. M4-SHS-6]|uniref:hypothetical protein n=1 Tax=Acidithiobacillus sp. M4-SHS-6 TaxID=3383024 RepID=UPI0039BEAAEE